MNTENFKEILLKKKQELQTEIVRGEEEARQSTADVGDPIDAVTSATAKAAALEESTLAAATLREVQDALDRITSGAYGRCVDCGREIEPVRLEAVPWTRYCRRDQEKHDVENPPASGSTL